jgi:hypothetical protein
MPNPKSSDGDRVGPYPVGPNPAPKDPMPASTPNYPRPDYSPKAAPPADPNRRSQNEV